MAQLPRAIVSILVYFCLAFLLETTAAFSATNPTIQPTALESEAPKPDLDEKLSPDERSYLLNKHLHRELLSAKQTSDESTNFSSNDIMEAALLSARDPSNTRYDPRFGRPALKAYRSFVYSDQHAADPLLLDGLAIKTAKHIKNMLKQHRNLAEGIVSPPKNKQNNNPPQHFREKIANSIAKGERRARERNNKSLREVCPGCSRPFNLCICDVLNEWNGSSGSSSSSNITTATPISERMVHTRLLVLQHPNEFRKKHTSTVPLLKLLLGEENVKIKVGYEFTMKDVLPLDGSNHGSPIMLFPGPDAIDLDKYVELQQVPGEQQDSDDPTIHNEIDNLPSLDSNDQYTQKKQTLVLIDGTWSEAKRIIRKSPEILEGCQMVQFAFDDSEEETTLDDANVDAASSAWPTQPESESDKAIKSRSIYHAMRKEPEEHCLSTLEACGEALKILEGAVNGPILQEALTSVLSKHVELHLRNAREASQSRHNRDTASRDSKIKRSKEIEQSIYGRDATTEDTSMDRPSSEEAEKDTPMSSQPTTIANTPTRSLQIDNDTSVTIRRLTHEDIPVIDAWWENGGAPKSIMTITRALDADYRLGIGASLGIVDETTGALVACIIRYESGPLGILHVSEELRGNGYGTALVKEATKALCEANRGREVPLEYSAMIKDGNTASERVFSKVGFVRENPNAKKGSGRRRANRKWIYVPTSEQVESIN